MNVVDVRPWRTPATVVPSVGSSPTLALLRPESSLPTAIEKRDLPAIQGSILFLSVVFVVVNLLADVLYANVDPRLARE